MGLIDTILPKRTEEEVEKSRDSHNKHKEILNIYGFEQLINEYKEVSPYDTENPIGLLKNQPYLAVKSGALFKNIDRMLKNYFENERSYNANKEEYLKEHRVDPTYELHKECERLSVLLTETLKKNPDLKKSGFADYFMKSLSEHTSFQYHPTSLDLYKDILRTHNFCYMPYFFNRFAKNCIDYPYSISAIALNVQEFAINRDEKIDLTDFVKSIKATKKEFNLNSEEYSNLVASSILLFFNPYDICVTSTCGEIQSDVSTRFFQLESLKPLHNLSFNREEVDDILAKEMIRFVRPYIHINHNFFYDEAFFSFNNAVAIINGLGYLGLKKSANTIYLLDKNLNPNKSPFADKVFFKNFNSWPSLDFNFSERESNGTISPEMFFKYIEGMQPDEIIHQCYDDKIFFSPEKLDYISQLNKDKIEVPNMDTCAKFLVAFPSVAPDVIKLPNSEEFVECFFDNGGNLDDWEKIEKSISE